MVLYVVFSCAQGRSEYDRTLKAMTTVNFMADGALCNFRALIILIYKTYPLINQLVPVPMWIGYNHKLIEISL